ICFGFRGRSEDALTALRTSWSLKTLQEQTIMKPIKPWVMQPHRYSRARRDAKGKAAFSSNSKLMPGKYWNESKKAVCAVNHTGADVPAIFRASIAATAAIAAASSAVPAGIAGRGGTIRRRAVAAEPGKQVPAVAA